MRKKERFPAVECTYTVGMLYDLLGLYILRNLIAELEHLMTKLKMVTLQSTYLQ